MTYEAPKRWSDIARVKQRMQIDMLTEAGKGARDAGIAAARIGITRNLYVTTCRRLGVPVDNLIEQNHPRWGRAEA